MKTIVNKAAIRYQFDSIKVEALESSKGHKAGDIVYFSGNLGGENVIIKCKVREVLFCGGGDFWHYRLIVDCYPNNKNAKVIDANESLFRQDPFLVYVETRDGSRVRINKNDLDNPDRKMLPIYNRQGVKIIASATYNHKMDSGNTHIVKENIKGTPEYAVSDRKLAELYSQMEAEDREKSPS